MKKFIYILISLLVIFFILILYKSDSSKKISKDVFENQNYKEQKTASKPVSPSIKALFDNFEVLQKEQEIEAKKALEQKKINNKKLMINLAIKQTLAELIKLDLNKDDKKIRELIQDLTSIGKRAIKAIREMLKENRPENEILVLIKAIGAFKGFGIEKDLLHIALTSSVKNIRDAALNELKDNPKKELLANQVVKNLKSKNKTEITANISALGYIGNQTATDELAHIINTTNDPTERRAAIKSIGITSSDETINFLLDLLYSNEETMKTEMAEVLGQMKNEQATVGLGNILLDKEASEQTKIAAINGLAITNDLLSYKILKNVLNDSSQTRDIYKNTITAILRNDNNKNQDEIYDFIKLFETTKLEYLPQMLQPLLATGKDKTAQSILLIYAKLDDTKKIHAVRTLGRIKSPEALNSLEKSLYSEKDISIKTEILSQIKECMSDNTSEQIIEIYKKSAINGPDKKEKITALKNLVQISPNDALEISEELLTKEADLEFYSFCVNILKEHGTSQNQNALLIFRYTENGEKLSNIIDQAIDEINKR